MNKALLKKYEIKTDKTDMLSSLKELPKDILKEALEENDTDNIEELSKTLIEEFESILKTCTNDFATILFFKRLLKDENTSTFSAYEMDIENFNVFVYKKDNYYTYYIPDELKRIVKKLLKI